MKRLSVLAAAALAAGSVVLAAPSARGATLDGVCQYGEVCLYSTTNYGYDFRDEFTNNTNYNDGDKFVKYLPTGGRSNLALNDQVRSLYNMYGSLRLRLYRDALALGPYITLARAGTCTISNGQSGTCYYNSVMASLAAQGSSHYFIS